MQVGKFIIGIVVAGTAVSGLAYTLNSSQGAAQEAKQKEVVSISADDAKLFKEVVPGVSKAALRGDADKGAYSAFTKFAPGQKNALHTHTSDTWIVVLKGAYIYTPENGAEKRVGPNGYIFIPGGTKHTSAGDAKDGALFFEESSGKFDLVFVDKK